MFLFLYQKLSSSFNNLIKKILDRYKKPVEQLPLQYDTILESCILSQLVYKDPQSLTDTIIKQDYPVKKYDIVKRILVQPFIFYNGNPEQDAQAYLWLIPDQRQVYIVFRGTSSINDLLAYIDIRTSRIKVDDTKTYVHTGFLNQYKAIHKNIISDLLKLSSLFDEIICAGHSLGGGLATIAAAECILMFKECQTYPKRISCYTFGSPRVCNQAFGKWFSKHIDNSVRVVNDNDPIPVIPTSPWFYHVNLGIYIDDKSQIQVQTGDYPWYLRILSTFAALDFKSPILEHKLNPYIERLFILQKETMY